MDLMHHEDRMLTWVGAAVFALLIASALLIALNRDSDQTVATLDPVAVPPITHPSGL